MSQSYRIRVGKKIREYRSSFGWTQEALAERAHLHPTYIGGIERGERNVSLDNIVRIARALKRHPAELFAGLSK